MLKKYGIKSALCFSEFREKGKISRIEKYGNENFNNSDKATLTSKNRYGTGRNNAKVEETMLRKYGVKSYLSSDEINKIRNCKEIQEKIQKTKRLNKTFNTSSCETKVFDFLIKNFKDVRRQYKSNEYPFNCDFYIGDIDTYIECNFHWTHGFHPYNENNEDDLNVVKKWKSKNTKFYDNAIKTWTIKDVEKRNIAKNNHLNFIELWKSDETIAERLGVKLEDNDN